MNDLSVIANKMTELERLLDKQIILFDGDIDAHFHGDIKNFLVGQTLPVKDGKTLITAHLFKLWLEKLKTHGFDKEIDFSK